MSCTKHWLTGKVSDLFELEQTCGKSSRHETRAIVSNILGNHNTHVIEDTFEFSFSSKSLMSACTNNTINKDIARGSVDKNTAAAEAFLVERLPIPCEEVTRCTTDEVVNKYMLTRIDTVLLE